MLVARTAKQCPICGEELNYDLQKKTLYGLYYVLNSNSIMPVPVCGECSLNMNDTTAQMYFHSDLYSQLTTVINMCYEPSTFEEITNRRYTSWHSELEQAKRCIK